MKNTAIFLGFFLGAATAALAQGIKGDITWTPARETVVIVQQIVPAPGWTVTIDGMGTKPVPAAFTLKDRADFVTLQVRSAPRPDGTFASGSISVEVKKFNEARVMLTRVPTATPAAVAPAPKRAVKTFVGRVTNCGPRDVRYEFRRDGLDPPKMVFVHANSHGQGDELGAGTYTIRRYGFAKEKSETRDPYGDDIKKTSGGNIIQPTAQGFVVDKDDWLYSSQCEEESLAKAGYGIDAKGSVASLKGLCAMDVVFKRGGATVRKIAVSHEDKYSVATKLPTGQYVVSFSFTFKPYQASLSVSPTLF